MEKGEALLCAGITHEDDAAEMLAVLSSLVNLLSNLSDLVEVILSDILSTHDFISFQKPAHARLLPEKWAGKCIYENN